MIYVRKKGRDTWHWMTTCRHWKGFRSQGLFTTWVAGITHFIKEKRPHGDLCNECKAKGRGKQ